MLCKIKTFVFIVVFSLFCVNLFAGLEDYYFLSGSSNTLKVINVKNAKIVIKINDKEVLTLNNEPIPSAVSLIAKPDDILSIEAYATAPAILGSNTGAEKIHIGAIYIAKDTATGWQYKKIFSGIDTYPNLWGKIFELRTKFDNDFVEWSISSSPDKQQPVYIDDSFGVLAQKDDNSFYFFLNLGTGIPTTYDNLKFCVIPNIDVKFIAGNIYQGGQYSDIYIRNEKTNIDQKVFNQWQSSNPYTTPDNPELNVYTFIPSSTTTDYSFNDTSFKLNATANKFDFYFNIPQVTNFVIKGDNYYLNSKGLWQSDWQSVSLQGILQGSVFYPEPVSFVKALALGTHTIEVINKDKPDNIQRISFTLTDSDLKSPDNSTDNSTLLDELQEFRDKYNSNFTGLNIDYILKNFAKTGDKIGNFDLPTDTTGTGTTNTTTTVLKRWCEVYKLSFYDWSKYQTNSLLFFSYLEPDLLEVLSGVIVRCYETDLNTTTTDNTTVTSSADNGSVSTRKITIPDDISAQIELLSSNKSYSFNTYNSTQTTSGDFVLWNYEQLTLNQDKECYNVVLHLQTPDVSKNIEYSNFNEICLSQSNISFTGKNDLPFTINYNGNDNYLGNLILNFDIIGKGNVINANDIAVDIVFFRNDSDNIAIGDKGTVRINLGNPKILADNIYEWQNSIKLAQLVYNNTNNKNIKFYIDIYNKNTKTRLPGNITHKIYSIDLPDVNYPLYVVNAFNSNMTIGKDYKNNLLVYIPENYDFSGVNIKIKLCKIENNNCVYLDDKFNGNPYLVYYKDTWFEKNLNKTKNFEFPLYIKNDFWSFVYTGRYIMTVSFYDSISNELINKYPIFFTIK